MVGDLLVRPRSAYGRDRRGRTLFPGADVLHVGRTDHFGLLNHPEVHARAASVARMTAATHRPTASCAPRTTIDAPPERVWALLTDFSGCPTGARSWCG